jgi:hypothetical protein
MRYRRRFKKTGKPHPPRGVKLPRNRKFEAKLETDSGARVRSRYEKRCADFLHSKRIRFIYEPLILLDERQYRPDFYLPDHDVFLEICGYGHVPYYNDRIAHKMRIYHKHDLSAVFIYYDGRGSLEDLIANELRDLGVPVT